MGTRMFVFLCVGLFVLLRGPTLCQGDPSLGVTVLDFSLDVYNSVRDVMGDGENMLLSPFSLNHALLMVYRGARGDTATQIENVMAFEDVGQNWGAEIVNVSSTGENSLASVYIANRAFIDQQFEIYEDYVQILEDEHSSGIELVPFGSDPSSAVDIINTWVEENTDGKIEDLVSETTITTITRLVLTNTLYFKAPWKIPFSESETALRPFHVIGSDSPIYVPTMSDSITAKLAQDRFLKCKMMNLPYNDEDYVMTVILPSSSDDIVSLEDGLDGTTLTRLFMEVDMRSRTRVSVRFPKFTIESEFDFPSTLEEMGMVDLFDEADADLSGVSLEPLYVSALVQKTFIEVDEEGTEAAAATHVTVLGRMGGSPWLTFHCDHPFVFYIRHIPTESVLFMGRVMDPSAP